VSIGGSRLATGQRPEAHADEEVSAICADQPYARRLKFGRHAQPRQIARRPPVFLGAAPSGLIVSEGPGLIWVISGNDVTPAVIPLKPDIHQRGLHVRIVPGADVVTVVIGDLYLAPLETVLPYAIH
jgi:hypothetical protein